LPKVFGDILNSTGIRNAKRDKEEEEEEEEEEEKRD
jgi:hypothetical protein